MLVCFGSILFIALIQSFWALMIGMIGWAIAGIVFMALLLKNQQLRYCRASLTSTFNRGMLLAQSLGEQQLINQQLIHERNQLIVALNGGAQIIPLEKKKKKIKN